jgi:hypothetical protein
MSTCPIICIGYLAKSRIVAGDFKLESMKNEAAAYYAPYQRGVFVSPEYWQGFRMAMVAFSVVIRKRGMILSKCNKTNPLRSKNK